MGKNDNALVLAQWLWTYMESSDGQIWPKHVILQNIIC
jgi:hypothetical protein